MKVCHCYFYQYCYKEFCFLLATALRNKENFSGSDTDDENQNGAETLSTLETLSFVERNKNYASTTVSGLNLCFSYVAKYMTL